MSSAPRTTAPAIAWPVVATTILTISALYAPQPLLPALVEVFGVSREAAAALTTVTFIPLALAPLAYGVLLEAVSATVVLRTAVVLLAVSEFVFAMTPTFGGLLVVRLLQGLLIPALLTSAMTFQSRRAEALDMGRALAAHVAATIAGGFLGRAVSGALAGAFGWRTSFLVLGVSLLIVAIPLWRLPSDGVPAGTRLPRGILWRTVRRPGLLPIYGALFCQFLAFAAVMNFLPFRLTELSPRADTLRIGLMYAGYTMGLATSLGAPWVVGRLGGARRTIRLGMLVFLALLACLAAGQVAVLFAVMFAFCGIMFLVHATASGLVNRLAGERDRGLLNGLYVAFYYGGGAVGSFAPGWVYRHWGWYGFLGAVGLVAVAGWVGSRGIPSEISVAEAARRCDHV